MSGDKNIKINGHEVKFKYEIDKIVEVKNICIVMLEVPSNKIYNENIFGVDKTGKIIWQIEKVKHIYKSSPYMDLFEKDEQIWAGNWDGDLYRLDIQTGIILEKKYTK